MIESVRFSSLIWINSNTLTILAGHPAGDRLLKLAAQQLKSSIRSKDCVARFGGDEFAVVTRDVSRREAKILANTILKDMRKLSHIEDGQVFHLQCSIGISMIRSDRFQSQRAVGSSRYCLP